MLHWRFLPGTCNRLMKFGFQMILLEQINYWFSLIYEDFHFSRLIQFVVDVFCFANVQNTRLTYWFHLHNIFYQINVNLSTWYLLFLLHVVGFLLIIECLVFQFWFQIFLFHNNIYFTLSNLNNYYLKMSNFYFSIIFLLLVRVNSETNGSKLIISLSSFALSASGSD